MDMPLRELGDTCTSFIDLERLRHLPGHRDEELLEHLDGKAPISRVPQAADEGLRPIPFRAAGRIMGVDEHFGVDKDTVTDHATRPCSTWVDLLFPGRVPSPGRPDGARGRGRTRSRDREFP